MLQLRFALLTDYYMNIHTGRLLTGPQITQEASIARRCEDLAGLLITLGQTEA